MGILGTPVAYDPASAASLSTASLLAMTAVDTTNCRITFTAPTNGIVQVRARCLTVGATTYPRILLGVLNGATVMLRMSPIGTVLGTAATYPAIQEMVGYISGLTAGNSYTFDLAYGVEVVLASTNIKYGGPNDTAGADAWGLISFEIWDTPNLLAVAVYDPSSAATKFCTSLLAMTAFDTTNLRLTVIAPSSGDIFWRLRTQFHGSSTMGVQALGILESSTVVARQISLSATPSGVISTSCLAHDASGVLSGVSGGSHTYDAALAVQVVASAGGFKHGGPNNTTTNDAFGATVFELWKAA